MKLHMGYGIAALLSLCFSIVIAGPVEDAANQLKTIQNNINQQIAQVRTALGKVHNTLQQQQKNLAVQQEEIVSKHKLIATGRQTLVTAQSQVSQQILMPKDIKQPLLEMFSYQSQLLNEMNTLLLTGKRTTEQINSRVAPAIASINAVVSDFNRYNQIINNAFQVVFAALNPLIGLERAPQAIEQGAKQAGQEIKDAFQSPESFKQAVESVPDKTKKAFKDFGNLLGL